MSAAAVVAVGVVAAGVTALLTGGDSSSSDADARDATSIFAAEPAARTDGLDQELNAVASMGDTTVAAGGVADHTGYRAAFLVSTDGARSFRLGSVLRPNGEAPSLGEVPRQIAGRQGAWVALGSRPGGTALWTSGDGRSWIRQPDAASTAFGPRDRVVQLVGDPSGFVAVGGTSAKGDFTDVAPVYWHSKDGRTWQRIAGDQLGMDPQGGTIELVNAAVNGPTILAQGVRTKKRSRPLNAVWKSGNGGRSWSEVDVPAPAGTIGLTIAAGGRGFVAAREIAHGGNAKATVFTSPDGNRWTKTGDITAPGYQRLWRLWPSSQGLSAAVNADGVVRLLRSGDATTWQPTGEVPVSAERIVAGSADSGGSSVIVGRDLGDDVNPVLAVRDAQGQDVQARIPSLQADHVVQTVAAGRDRLVAAGSTNGDAAVWTSGDGNDWSRADVKALARPGRQRLLNVTSGSAGWLAVGVDATAPWRPLVAASTDGSAWQALDGGKAFEPQSRTPLVTYAAASSPSGYVIVGEDGFAPAAWFSSDLRSWTRAAGVTKDDLAGTQEANRWMRGVAGGSFGYVAVGGLRDPSVKNAQAVRPCVWTSADGQKWAAHQLPVPAETSEGWLRSVAVKGNVLVAVGTANIPTGARHFAFVSSDGGRNWQETDLPNAGNAVPDSSMKVTATPKGFVAVGTTGYQANADVVMWTSTDGRNWKRSADPPEGLGGQGDQELTGLAASGSRLLGVGASADAEGRRPLLWRTPVP